MDFEPLLADLAPGRTGALARAISLVENGRPGFEGLLAALHPRLGHARRIGITGPPGAGKSTLVRHLVEAWRRRGLTVAVIAVDPTSPFSGGALLGDRIRMETVALDPGVYIRSMATRGSLGGLATSTREVLDVLDAGGFDRLLIETVGVGQSELAVTGMADSTVLVLVPESGDGIQTLKSGVMEIADLFVVNKADRPGAGQLAREIEITLGLRRGNAFRGMRAHHGVALGRKDGKTEGRKDGTAEGGTAPWEPPVLLTVAPKGEGVDALIDALDRHHDWMTAAGELALRRKRRFAVRTREVVDRALQRWTWGETRAEALLAERLDQVAAGRMSPYELAGEIVAGLKEGARR
ncbi:MAG: methylmalonyl Co-A mutase-associated GTPase MeaB [Gemmatimonadetes bacterium]|nr:MAG: methylmalonyl Co-A mutase-associated GTPase MeaB [Gemmatimonadota bacterium]